jgi:hypothetical protein
LLSYSIYCSYAIFFNWLQDNLKQKPAEWNSWLFPTSGSELFHDRERCAVRHSYQMLYFFQNNGVPQFFNGMVCWHYHLQWICGYVHVYKIIKQLFHACSGKSQNYCHSVLEMTWELVPEAEVLKSSPAPRVNSFDYSMNRHEGLRQQFSSHLQHIGSIVLTVPWTGMKYLYAHRLHNICTYICI